MTPPVITPPLPRTEDDVCRALRDRCVSLGLPTWLCDARGTIVADPVNPVHLAPFLGSRTVRQRVSCAVRRCAESRQWGVVELDTACWLIVLPPAGTARGTCMLAAIAWAGDLGRSALAGDARRELGAAKVDAALVGATLTCGSRRDADRLANLLTWSQEDQLRIARDKAALDGFGAHLAEMYEEIGLLYRLGRSMGQVARPEDFVENACIDLQQTLSFGWIAAKFNPAGRAPSSLTGQLIVAGNLPCDQDEFDTAAARLFSSIHPDRWSLIRPKSSELARLVGAELLAHPITRDNRIIGVLLAGGKGSRDTQISSFETQLLDAVSDCIRVFIENSDLYADQHSLFVGTIEALAAAIDAKDRYTCGHSERVAHLAYQLALATGMDEVGAERIRISGLLHDVGKIGVPEAILSKPGRLTPQEFDQIKLHPRMGETILKDIPFLDDILPGVLYHHERLDGKGYPDGLVDKQIPLVARLLSVADAFDAMSSSRSYRAAMTREQVLAELRRGAGTQFDPELVDLFLTLDLQSYDRMVAGHQSLPGLAA